ncbi:MAG: AAA family ATPase [Myxococcales bacterium]|nr:AAA family ATPase [Myxococcales bacterium]
MTREPALRAAGRRSEPSPRARCSCDLLLGLCDEPAVRALLAGFSAAAADLRRCQAQLHAEVESEPADWRVRIAQRTVGRAADHLHLLLAIVRSADSHAYQLLDRAGVPCGALRRRLIDAVREAENVAAHGPREPARRAATPTRTTAVPRAAEAPRSLRGERPAGEPPMRLRSSDARPAVRDEPAEPPTRLRSSDARLTVRDDPAEPPPRLRSSDARPAVRDDPAEPPTRLRSSDASTATTRADVPLRLHRDGAAESSSRLRRPSDEPGPDVPARARRVHHDEPAVATRTRRAAHDGETHTTAAHPDLEPAALVEPRPAPLDRPHDPPRLTPLQARELAPLHGRDPLLARLADAVLRRSPRPPLLVGPHGCGRTTLATHLARVVPQPVFLLSAAAYADEDALRADLHAVARQRGVAILDDLDQLGSDAPPACLPALVKIWSSGQPPVVTIVSPEGRARLEAWLPGMASTFDVLTVPPLEGDDLRAAVAAAAPAVLAEHRVGLTAGARLSDLTRLADRFLGGLALPGRALDLLDLACARTVREGRNQVSRDTWIDIVCERSGVPRERVEGHGNQEILDLEGELGRRVVGHEHVIRALSELIRRNRAGFASQRPVATVLLLGPSGVGKTEIAKALCGALFERPDALVRLDMSEYAESHAVARVIGAPPGYVGHEHGGALTDPLLRQPHCVVLLDEIEKAHRDVHQLLLQVFDEGRLTDGRGRTVDFRHAVVLMTSNLGAACLDEAAADDARLDQGRVLDAARAAFPVELWNRIEAPLVLHPLSQRELATICQRLARAASERLFRERGIRYRLDDRACRHLVAQCGRDSALGARPLRHVLARQVESRVADAILRGQVRAGMLVEVGLDAGDLVLTAVRA